jgi:hypothetical protein
VLDNCPDVSGDEQAFAKHTNSLLPESVKEQAEVQL